MDEMGREIHDYLNKYYNRIIAVNMEKLKKIYIKNKNKQELTKEELRFLYEVDGHIHKDIFEGSLMLEAIINGRNIRKDLSYLFDCKEEQIALEESEINEHTICYRGNYKKEFIHEKKLIFPPIMIGNIHIELHSGIDNLVLPQHMSGDVYLDFLDSAEGVVFPKHLGGSLGLNSLKTAESLVLPRYIGGNLFLSSLKEANGLILPQYLGGSLFLDSLLNAEGVVFPQDIGENLYLSRLETPKGLVLPRSVGVDLGLESLRTAEGLILPHNIGGMVNLWGLHNIESLDIPDTLTYDIEMHGFTITPKNVDEYKNNKNNIKK